MAYRWGAGGFYGGPGYANPRYDQAHPRQSSEDRGGPRAGYAQGWQGTYRTGYGRGRPYGRRDFGAFGADHYGGAPTQSSRGSYDRGYEARFRRLPEGAELKEFRPEEMGRLWDR